MKQFSDVNTSRGAPMGRPHTYNLDDTPKSVRLFKVRICSQGYDDGGAYWGLGQPLWCAWDSRGGKQFVRASSRIAAAAALGIPNSLLMLGLPRLQMEAYFRNFAEGRMPPSLLESADWREWFEANGYTIYDGSERN